VVEGYFGYYAVPGNEKRLRSFRDPIKRLWLRALRRRGQRDKMNWARMDRLEDRWLPPVQWKRPWPKERFDARSKARTGCGVPLVRVCAGGDPTKMVEVVPTAILAPRVRWSVLERIILQALGETRDRRSIFWDYPSL
jgi:hypothetical protein